MPKAKFLSYSFVINFSFSFSLKFCNSLFTFLYASSGISFCLSVLLEYICTAMLMSIKPKNAYINNLFV